SSPTITAVAERYQIRVRKFAGALPARRRLQRVGHSGGGRRGSSRTPNRWVRIVYDDGPGRGLAAGSRVCAKDTRTADFRSRLKGTMSVVRASRSPWGSTAGVIALLACWSSWAPNSARACISQLAPESRALAPGLWGGDHLRMVADRNGAQLEYDCATGTIDQ